MKTPFFKRIVWAVDTLEGAEFQTNAQFILGSLTRETSAIIYPVHVQSCTYPKTKQLGLYEEAYAALAEKRLKELKENSDLIGLQNGELLINQKSTTRFAVETLLKYAEQKEADAIVVATHSHSAVTKFFLGSFAETLLLQSDIPVITVNPKTKVREKISKVLFPTTFEKKFLPAFEKVLDLCSALDATLTAFYNFPHVAFFEMTPELIEWRDEAAAALENDINLFREKAHSRNVSLDVRIESKPADVASEVTSYAEERSIDLIAIASQTSDSYGPRAGSLCRRVVRSAVCPVWCFKLDQC